jgi:hypothetical protein
MHLNVLRAAPLAFGQTNIIFKPKEVYCIRLSKSCTLNKRESKALVCASDKDDSGIGLGAAILVWWRRQRTLRDERGWAIYKGGYERLIVTQTYASHTY